MSNGFMQPGCTALVTGAGSGFGKGLAHALAQRGLKVLYTDINAATAEQAAKETNSRWAVLDVADADAFKACIDGIVAEHGRFDLIINNAGFAVAGEARDTQPSDYRRIVEVNLMGVVNGALPAYQQMVKQGGGHIVNIASLAGLAPFPFAASYAMTKAGVVNFSHTLACEAEDFGVKVSVVCPSFIRTPIYDNATFVKQDKEELLSAIILPWMPIEDAVKATLRGVEKQRTTIIFPFHARLLWWASRLVHWIPHPFTQAIVRKARASRRRE